MTLTPSRPMRRPVRRRGGGRRHAAAMLLVGAALLTACGSGDSADAGDESPDLAGRSFTSTEVSGRTLVTGTEVSLAFEEDTVSAQAGCNTMFGEATWADGALVVTGPLAMTQMACERGLAAQDEWLSEFLSSEPPISLDGETLVLGTESEGITFTEDGS